MSTECKDQWEYGLRTILWAAVVPRRGVERISQDGGVPRARRGKALRLGAAARTSGSPRSPSSSRGVAGGEAACPVEEVAAEGRGPIGRGRQVPAPGVAVPLLQE